MGSRFPYKTLWKYFRFGVWEGHGKGNVACYCREVIHRLEYADDSLIGIGEIFLLPLDVLKIKRQTNPEAFRGRGLFKIVRDEGFALYRGWEWTAARNAPGSFAVPSLLDFLMVAFRR
jgi:hypothetical protein